MQIQEKYKRLVKILINISNPNKSNQGTLMESPKDRSGILFLSSIPPGMTPQDIRLHLSPFGTIKRLYLSPLKPPTIPKPSQKPLEPHKLKTKFVEGWIEFSNRAHAKTAASVLNSRPVNSSKPRHRGCLWAIKYLGSSFKWSHLTEQLEYNRQVREKRLREARGKARRENEFYLSQVEKSQARRRALKRAELGVSADCGNEESSIESHGSTKQSSGEPDKQNADRELSKKQFEELKLKFKQRKPILS